MRPKNVKQQASPFIETALMLNTAGAYKTDGRYFTRAFLEKRKRPNAKILIEAAIFYAFPLTGFVDGRALKRTPARTMETP